MEETFAQPSAQADGKKRRRLAQPLSGQYLNMRKVAVLMFLLIVLTLFTQSGCTKTIKKGEYGPFIIGESKQSALQKLKAMDISPKPIPFEEIYIESPSEKDFSRLNNYDGILVSLDHHPWPLRIEFADHKVIGTWGASKECRASQERMNVACEEVKRLNSRIKDGTKRDEIYNLLDGFDTQLSMQVGNFVVGYDAWWRGTRSKQKYDDLLLKNNAWFFHGLKELLWYDHFYSQVKVFFENEKLARIEHYRFPFELP